MATVVLSIHLVVCVALIGLVLLQRSEGGALGIGGGSGALMSGRGAADALAKMTQLAGALFLGISLLLTWMSGAARDSSGGSVFDNLPSFSAPATPAPDPVAPAEEQPAAPDPTQSSAPEAATSQLAAAPVQAASSVALGPASAAAGERAGPLNAAPPPPAPQRSTAQPTATRTAATTPARNTSAGGTTQNAANTTQPRTQPLRLPGASEASAALNNVPLDAVQTPESGEGAPLAPVRRERAGPDQ